MAQDFESEAERAVDFSNRIYALLQTIPPDTSRMAVMIGLGMVISACLDILPPGERGKARAMVFAIIDDATRNGARH